MTLSESDRLDECLPDNLRTTPTTITRIAGGLSGAGVHRVDADGRSFVLKISRSDESIQSWRTRLEILRLAADAGVALRVIHADEARRAVVGMGMQVSNGRGATESGAPIETLESTLSLGEFYQKLRTGELRLDSPEGGRAFRLALVKESFAL